MTHPDVDLVMVATPTPQHAESVRMALAAGKDVYCEWPLTTTTAIATELLELAQDNDARHLVGLQRRLAPHNRYVRELLEKGLPQVAQISGVQVYDSRFLIPLVESIPTVKGLAGRARKRPGKVHADRAYASRAHRAWLRSRGIDRSATSSHSASVKLSRSAGI